MTNLRVEGYFLRQPLTRWPAMTEDRRSTPPCRRLQYFCMRQTALAGKVFVHPGKRRSEFLFCFLVPSRETPARIVFSISAPLQSPSPLCVRFAETDMPHGPWNSLPPAPSRA